VSHPHKGITFNSWKKMNDDYTLSMRVISFLFSHSNDFTKVSLHSPHCFTAYNNYSYYSSLPAFSSISVLFIHFLIYTIHSLRHWVIRKFIMFHLFLLLLHSTYINICHYVMLHIVRCVMRLYEMLWVARCGWERDENRRVRKSKKAKMAKLLFLILLTQWRTPSGRWQIMLQV
jgi:hypothetical protein